MFILFAAKKGNFQENFKLCDYPKLANSDEKSSNHCVFKQTFIEMFRKLLQIHYFS